MKQSSAKRQSQRQRCQYWWTRKMPWLSRRRLQSFISYGKPLGEVNPRIRLWNGNVFILSITAMCGWYGNHRWDPPMCTARSSYVYRKILLFFSSEIPIEAVVSKIRDVWKGSMEAYNFSTQLKNKEGITEHVLYEKMGVSRNLQLGLKL